METPPTGYHAPLHQALSTPVLLAGVPRDLAIVLWTVVAALVLGLHRWPALLPGLLLHTVALSLTQMDAQWPQVVKRHLRYRPFYHV